MASQLIAAGESPERVRRLLGHKDIGTTIHTYGNHFDFPPNGALARLDALLVKSETPHSVDKLAIPIWDSRPGNAAGSRTARVDAGVRLQVSRD